jgi:hypothetical protein
MEFLDEILKRTARFGEEKVDTAISTRFRRQSTSVISAKEGSIYVVNINIHSLNV